MLGWISGRGDSLEGNASASANEVTVPHQRRRGETRGDEGAMGCFMLVVLGLGCWFGSVLVLASASASLPDYHALIILS